MPIPTFNGVELASGAVRDLPGCPAVRMLAETLPGIDGQFVQTHGKGAREIVVRGVLSTGGGTPAAAHQTLKLALRDKQTLADGATVATYVGTDGAQYTNCVLTAYEPAGEVQLASGGSGSQAALPVEIHIVHLTP